MALAIAGRMVTVPKASGNTKRSMLTPSLRCFKTSNTACPLLLWWSQTASQTWLPTWRTHIVQVQPPKEHIKG